MSERKLLFFVLFIFIYCLYSVQLWYLNLTEAKEQDASPDKPTSKKELVIPDNIVKKQKVFPLNTCDVTEILIINPFICEKKEKRKPEKMYADSNTVTVIGITAFLLILTINAILDVIKVKEEERARRKLNPDGEVRRQSLAEFANKKSLRRESAKFGQKLFKIAESFVNGNGGGENEDTKKPKRQTRPYVRGQSINSYLSDKRIQTERSAPASIGDTGETKPKLVKRQSVARLFGARPVPMVRRSSFPALPLNPEVQALMLGHRQASFDSDDEDSKGRRVRLIRRY